jgi:hypothetical protein
VLLALTEAWRKCYFLSLFVVPELVIMCGIPRSLEMSDVILNFLKLVTLLVISRSRSQWGVAPQERLLSTYDVQTVKVRAVFLLSHLHPSCCYTYHQMPPVHSLTSSWSRLLSQLLRDPPWILNGTQPSPPLHPLQLYFSYCTITVQSYILYFFFW